jgi:DNA repair protein RadC
VGDSPAALHSTATPARNLHHLSARELIAELVGTDVAPGVLATAWPSTIMDLVHRDEDALANLLELQPEAARRLAAALELHERLVQWAAPVRPTITEPEQALAVLASVCTLPEEHFWCLALDTRCRLIGSPVEVSMGDVDGCDAGPRMFFRAALRCGAVQAIAVHNHPTGDPSPSAADQAVTRRLREAGRALDIKLVDHVIVTPDRTRWCSLRRETPMCFT